MKNIYALVLAVFFSMFIYACSSSSDSRHDENTFTPTGTDSTITDVGIYTATSTDVNGVYLNWYNIGDSIDFDITEEDMARTKSPSGTDIMYNLEKAEDGSYSATRLFESGSYEELFIPDTLSEIYLNYYDESGVSTGDIIWELDKQ